MDFGFFWNLGHADISWPAISACPKFQKKSEIHKCMIWVSEFMILLGFHLENVEKMVWFTKLTVLFFLECGWVGGVCWVVVLRGLRNFLVRMLSAQYWLCIVEHLLWHFFISKHFSEDFRFSCQLCAFQLCHLH